MPIHVLFLPGMLFCSGIKITNNFGMFFHKYYIFNLTAIGLVIKQISPSAANFLEEKIVKRVWQHRQRVCDLKIGEITAKVNYKHIKEVFLTEKNPKR